jgi:hypothetical protein
MRFENTLEYDRIHLSVLFQENTAVGSTSILFLILFLLAVHFSIRYYRI